MGLADSPHFLHFTREMIHNPDSTVKTWAQNSDTPSSTAYRVTNFFRWHHAIPGGVVDARKVLRLSSGLRRDRAVPRKTFVVKDAGAFLDELASTPHQLVFQSAANAIAYFESGDVHVRIEAGQSLPSPSSRPSRGAKTRVHAYIDRLERYPPPMEVDGCLVCDPVVTLMDLYSHPHGGAHAEFLYNVLVDEGILQANRA